jgi:hypothetical protein
MTVGGKPMIPGSSLRGVFRNAYEAITGSCVFLNNDYYFSSRTGASKNAGLLKRTETGWELLRSERYSDKECPLPDKYDTGDPVIFDGKVVKVDGKFVKHYLTKVGSGNKTGYVLIMNRFETKKGVASGRNVFEKISDNPIAGFSNDNEQIKAFKDNIDKYTKGAAEEHAKVYKKVFENLKIGGFIPVWYEECKSAEGKKFLFALSQMSRNVYTKKPKDFLGALKRCENRNELCPACALFGFIGDDNDSIGSRVRFSDAWCEAAGVLEDEDKKVRLLLSSPKSSSLEFYLRSNDNFYHADTDGVSLSGRKFYWHHSGFKVDKLRDKTNDAKDDKGTMSAKFQYAKRDVRRDVRFDFEVYFDGITQKQLDELYTALTYGDNNESGKLCHKLGHGKPLGFGSVKVVAEEIRVRSVSFKDGEVLYSEDKGYLDRVKPVGLPSELEKAVDFYAIPEEKIIDYPRYEGDGDIFKWFSENRNLSTRVENSKYHKKLPLVTEKEQELPFDPNPKSSNRNNAKGGYPSKPPGGGRRDGGSGSFGKSDSKGNGRQNINGVVYTSSNVDESAFRTPFREKELRKKK